MEMLLNFSFNQSNNYSYKNQHALTVFANIEETPGHKAAVNLLTRERLCQAIGITPEEYIDTLAWAMKNPSEPEIVDPSEAECYENMQQEADLTAIPIPHHWPQDRGRYSSASVIIAEYDGVLSIVDFKPSTKEKNESWIENYFIQGSAYAEMFKEHFGEEVTQIVILIVTEEGTTQVFKKNKVDYLPKLKEAVENFYKWIENNDKSN